jgi:hypothetical protein
MLDAQVVQLQPSTDWTRTIREAASTNRVLVIDIDEMSTTSFDLVVTAISALAEIRIVCWTHGNEWVRARRVVAATPAEILFKESSVNAERIDLLSSRESPTCVGLLLQMLAPRFDSLQSWARLPCLRPFDRGRLVRDVAGCLVDTGIERHALHSELLRSGLSGLGKLCDCCHVATSWDLRSSAISSEGVAYTAGHGRVATMRDQYARLLGMTFAAARARLTTGEVAARLYGAATIPP